MVPGSCTGRLEELDEMFRDDLLLAWLQHERVHTQAISRSFEHNRRFAAPQLLGSILGTQIDAAGIPVDLHVRHVVGNVGNVKGGADAGDSSDFGGYEIEA